MKKIVTFAVVLITAVSVQAASISWGGMIINSKNLNPMPTVSTSGAYLTLIYLGASAPVGSVDTWDYTTGLSNLGGEVLATQLITEAQASAAGASTVYSRADGVGGVNGYWMTVIYDPNQSADYFGYAIDQVSGATDVTPVSSILHQDYPGDVLDAGAQLQVVPEPATGMLALAGAALLLRRRRRA